MAVGTLLLPLAGASAETYCSGTVPYLCAGCTANATIKVVVASVPRKLVVGETNKGVWCGQHWGTMGGHSSFRIVKAPRLGNVSAHGDAIFYKGNRVGHDQMQIDMSWLGPSNQPLKGTFVFDIDVVAQPF
ncbi:MAG TPA: hypothetical protein VFB45_01635 [Pseudolabrys sp.]|nr:hypothetical protein [Pseudolabrys sp.]